MVELPANAPVWLYVLVIISSIAVPLVGAIALNMKRRSEAELLKLKGQIDRQKLQSDKEMEQVKTESAQALASTRSIEALTSTLVAMVDERKESTAATKENTAALLNMSTQIHDWDTRQGTFFNSFSGQVTKAIGDLQSMVSEVITNIKSNVDAVIPQLYTQVTPLVTRMEMLVREVKETREADNQSRDAKTDELIGELRETTALLRQYLVRFEQVIHRKIEIVQEEVDQPAEKWQPQSTEPVSTGALLSPLDGSEMHPQLARF